MHFQKFKKLLALGLTLTTMLPYTAYANPTENTSQELDANNQQTSDETANTDSNQKESQSDDNSLSDTHNTDAPPADDVGQDTSKEKEAPLSPILDENSKKETSTANQNAGNPTGNTQTSPKDAQGTETPSQKVENQTSPVQAPALQAPTQEGQSQENTGSNAALIANNPLTPLPSIETSFRFVKVEKDYAVSNVESLSFFEEQKESSRLIGTLPKDGLLFVLKDIDDTWLFAESGSVRGFVKKSDLLMDKEADEKVASLTEAKMSLAAELILAKDNAALTFTKTTVRETVIPKVFALTTASKLNVRESNSLDARIVGSLNQNSLSYIISDVDKDWFYVESGDVRGFVKKEFIKSGEEVAKEVIDKKEESFALAEELIKPSENKALYYTITSIKEAGISSAIRESLISYASLFVGNPYVWGGTSLTQGADCSGYVQSIFSQFGYELPRTSAEQSQFGTKIAYKDAAPGDLIFYAKGGSVYHVLIYVGEGKGLNAASTSQGIKVSDIDESKVVWATRVIKDEDLDKVEAVNEKAASSSSYNTALASQYGEKLGTFKLTAYCNCPICCGHWAGGPTASGTEPTQGRTVAMAGVPFGTKLIINGMLYTVEDRGTPYGHVDIYFNDHQEASNFGVQYADVYSVK
ncbi:MAG TPA: NlpC/P60 family protein [Lachnospiraceae bacterium]